MSAAKGSADPSRNKMHPRQDESSGLTGDAAERSQPHGGRRVHSHDISKASRRMRERGGGGAMVPMTECECRMCIRFQQAFFLHKHAGEIAGAIS